MDSKKILVIEDDISFRQLLVKAFGSAGYEVYEAGDGQAGLTAATSQGGFAVILTDMKMPNMDGLVLIRELMSRTAQVPNGPIVALSSMGDDYVKEEAIRSGAVAFFNKHTMEPLELVDAVSKIIKDHPIKGK